MPKIRKMTIYVIDYNSTYEEREDAIPDDIQESLEDLGFIAHVGEAEESENVIWRSGDELPILHQNATDEDYEAYFKK